MSRAALIVIALVLCAACAEAKKKPAPVFGPKDDVLVLNMGNFETLIKKHRDNRVSIVNFFQSSSADSKAFADEYKKLGTDLKGIVKIAAVDCDEDYSVCERERATDKFPTVVVYPPNPIPAQKFEGELSAKALAAFATRFVQSQVVRVAAANVDVFLTDKPALPKALLFTNKKTTPLLYKALSNDFLNKVIFGEVHESEAAIAKRYKVKKFPTLLLWTPAKPDQPYEFKGEISYQNLFEFINPYSETFVMGGGYSDAGASGGAAAGSAAARPWLVQPVPELHKHSYEDVCGKSGGLCAILLAPGRADPAHLELLEALAQRYQLHIERGTKVKFAWLDTAQEPAVAAAFKAEALPALAVLNPGKRKRFVMHSGELAADAINAFLDRVIGGDARFTAIPQMPAFADRKLE